MADAYRHIPEELKSLPQWVCWTTDKLPKNPHTGGNAQSNNPTTWGGYQDALLAMVKYQFNGIGFMFAGGYFGVDIDKVSECQDLVDEFVETLHSYTEVSTSGNGIHIICKGKLPTGGRRRGHVEMYQTGRYFIMTGNVYNGEVLEIADCTEQVKPLHAKYLAERMAALVERKSPEHIVMSDTEIVDRARASASGAAFQMLYQGGWQGAYGSQSEADLAFCNHLAFWTQKDTAQMDRIFRSSGLYRDKWDKKSAGTTYGARTIEKAVTGVQDVYDPRGEDQAVTVTAAMFKKRAGADRRKFYEQTDTGNAAKFTDMFGKNLHYSYQNKTWLFWGGKFWEEDITGEIKKLADQVLVDMKKRAFEIEDEKEMSAALRWVNKSAASRGKVAMITEAQHLENIPVKMSDFDKDADMLNCQSGVINLRNGELIPHDPAYLNTRISYADYNPASGGKPERWLKFLSEITDGDEDLQRYLQKAVGYSLTGSIREQCMFFCYGTGQNGKSTFLDIVSAVCGTYASHAQPESIMLTPKQGGGAQTDIARLKGARFVTTVEPNEGVKLNEGLIKQLTGGDKVTARFLYGKEFEYVPEFKLWLGANHKPVIRGTDLGIWRRIRLIPFIVQIPDARVDKGLIHKLRGELPQILNWAVEGCIMWQREGLGLPKAVEQATTDYKQEMDKIAQFCDESIVVEYGARTRASDLYEAYSRWADDNHEYKLSNTKFGKEIALRFPEKVRAQDGFWYRDMTLLRQAVTSTHPSFGSFRAVHGRE